MNCDTADIHIKMTELLRILALSVIIIAQNHMMTNVMADCTSDLQKPTGVIDIQENTPAGAVLHHVTSDVHNIRAYPDNSSQELSGDFVTLLDGAIVTKTNVTLDGPSNRNDSCKRALFGQRKLKLICNNDNKTGVNVNFQMLLTDNYSPMFIQETVSIPETYSVRSTVLDLETIAYDPDCQTTYFFYIDDVMNYFSVINNKHLVLNKQLDYELNTEHRFNLTVSTRTGNLPDQSNTTVFTILVTDEDDMSPVFDIGLFILHHEEGQTAPSAWLNATPPILARDGDVGINETLEYSILNTEPNLAIVIKNDTGEVKILQSLDRENITTYKVIVKATQQNLSYRSATATLIVHVDDINDNQPVFRSPNNATIFEDAPTGSVVMELIGTDIDEKPNNEFDFVILSDSISAFDIKVDDILNRVYLVVNNSIILRGRSQVTVELMLQERQTPSQCNYVTNCVAIVTVYINEINKNTPVFDRSVYEFNVVNNITGHIVVGQVIANDSDTGDNGRVAYNWTTILGPANCSKFIIDSVVGEISISQRVPAGIVCSWIVYACDSPLVLTLRRCGSSYLSVTVTSSGTLDQWDVSISENVPIGTLVAAMPIKGLTTTSAEFSIENDMLFTKINLDREKQDLYTVLVQSTRDKTLSVLIIHVNVIDVNDNAPEFDYPVYIINMNGSETIGQMLIQVNASDKDMGNNSQIAFSLVTGKDYFAIDAKTGVISFLYTPMANGSEYHLLVQDFGNPSLSGVASLRVYSPIYNETATIILPVSKDKLMADRDGVAKVLSSILGVTVRILNIESLSPVPDMGSKLYITANSANGQAIGPTELNSLLDKHAKEIYQKYVQSCIKNGSNTSEDLSQLEVALICVCVILFVLLLLLTILWCRSHKKFKQSQRLFDTLNKDTPIYDNLRKESTTAHPVGRANGSNGALKFVSPFGNGSVGHSSPARHTNNSAKGSEPIISPVKESSSRKQVDSYAFENVRMNSIQTANDNDYTVLVSSEAAPKSENAIKSSSQNENSLNRLYPNLVNSETEQNLQQSVAENHPSLSHDSDNKIDSDNVGTTSKKKDNHYDEDDEEVANILSEINHLEDNTASNNDASAIPVDEAHLNLMRTHTPVIPQSDNPTDISSNPATNNGDITEPEPDYAKKVRFSEASKSNVNPAVVDNEADYVDNISLEKLLSNNLAPTKVSEPAANTNTIDDGDEQLTAL